METRFASPGGRYHFDIESWEARMSLWGETPQLFDSEQELSVFDLRGTNWSLNGAEWTGVTKVNCQLRRYPGDHFPTSFEFEVDCSAKTVRVEGEIYPLNAFETRLEALYLSHQTKNLAKPASFFNRLKSWFG